MEVLAIIPARGGSKSIPRKNLAPLLGRPLLSYTCEAALRSKLLSRILVSTDDDEIAGAARACGVQVLQRPASIAGDSTPMLPVLQHALSSIAPYRPDVVVTLQPTSPLRTAEHVDGVIRRIEESGADTVVTVVEVPHQFNPVSVMKMEDGVLSPLAAGEQILRRQDKPRVYARNGPAVLATRTEVIEAGELYGAVVHGFLMAKTDSIDVDDPEDLKLAEFYLKRRARS